jgi:hypothetical protein
MVTDVLRCASIAGESFPKPEIGDVEGSKRVKFSSVGVHHIILCCGKVFGRQIAPK